METLIKLGLIIALIILLAISFLFFDKGRFLLSGLCNILAISIFFSLISKLTVNDYLYWCKTMFN